MRRLGALSVLAVGAMIAVPARAASDVEGLCTRTVFAYADAWDHADGPKFVSLFAEDATLDLGTGPAKGRAAIAELFGKRNPGASTRHLMTNVQITPQGSGQAEGLSYLMLFAGPPRAATETAPTSVDGFALVGEYRDRFQIGPGGCRFAERRLTPIFRRARPAPPAAPATRP